MTSQDISRYPHTHEEPVTDAELVAHLHDILETLGTTAVEKLLEIPPLLDSTEQLLLDALQTIQKLAKQSTPKMIPEEAEVGPASQPTLRLLPDTSL